MDTGTQLIAAINVDSTWGSGITVTAAQDATMKSYETISLTNAAGAAINTQLNTGATLQIEWQLGTTTGVAAIGANSTVAQIATAVSAAISGTATNGLRWNSDAVGNAVRLIAEVTKTGTQQDLGPGVTFPRLSFNLGNITNTTIDLSPGVNTNSTGVNSDFFLGVAQTITKGLRISVLNNSTTVALTGLTVTDTVGDTLLGNGFTALVSGTNMTGNNAIDATFAEVTTPGAGVLVVTTNRLGW